MDLSRPPWPVFLINFSLNRRGNVNNCVTRAVTLKYIIPVSNKSQLATLEHLGEKRKAQWTTFNFNTLKGIALEISTPIGSNLLDVRVLLRSVV